ncbi:MAG: hypothetical protein BJ554DRAFT_8180, partial [Olpidium bornovanus]
PAEDQAVGRFTGPLHSTAGVVGAALAIAVSRAVLRPLRIMEVRRARKDGRLRFLYNKISNQRFREIMRNANGAEALSTSTATALRDLPYRDAGARVHGTAPGAPCLSPSDLSQHPAAPAG